MFSYMHISWSVHPIFLSYYQYLNMPGNPFMALYSVFLVHLSMWQCYNTVVSYVLYIIMRGRCSPLNFHTNIGNSHSVLWVFSQPLEMEPRISYILEKHFPSDLYSQPQILEFYKILEKLILKLRLNCFCSLILRGIYDTRFSPG